jgi:multicomponent Na+:H+ antiporter subunit D
MMTDALLPALVLVPLLGAGFALTQPRGGPIITTAVAAVLLATVTRVATEVLRSGRLDHAAGAWGAPFGIELRADGPALLLLAVTVVIGTCITLYAVPYFRPSPVRPDDRGVRYFWPLWLLVWAALNAIYLSTDLFNLYVCLELVTLPAVGLVALEGTRAAVAAAIRYLLLSLLGSLAFLLGIVVVYSGAGTLALPVLAAAPLEPAAARLALTLMTLGLAAKAALFPLHFWLPPAHASAPAPASAVLSGLVVKAAFYIALRIWIEPFPGALSTAGPILIGGMGAAAVLWGSVMALRQARVKLIIAWSTVAQIGYLFLVFPLLAGAPAAAWTGGMYHLLSHALAKAALFLAAGAMVHALGDDRLDALAGVGQKMPVTFTAFGIAALNLVGLPPSGGFIGKWLLLTASMTSGQWWWAVVIAVGSLLAAGYVLLVLRTAFLRPAAEPLPHQPPLLMTVAALGLALIALALGLWAEIPLALLGAAAPGASI